MRRGASFDARPRHLQLNILYGSRATSFFLRSPHGKCLRSGPLVLRLETLVTTDNIRPENSDWQEPIVEQLPVSETSTPLVTRGAPLVVEQAPTVVDQIKEVAGEAVMDDKTLELGNVLPQQEDKRVPLLASDSQKHEFSEQRSFEFEVVSSPNAPVEAHELPPIQELAPAESASDLLLPSENETPLQSEEEAARPFTDFIEEFRQREVRLNALLHEPESSFTAFIAKSELVSAATSFAEIAATESERRSVVDVVINPQEVSVETGKQIIEAEATHAVEEIRVTGLTQPTLSAERPVSPLLRPATRIRLPRHSRHRIDELIQPAELQAEQAKAAPVLDPPAQEKPTSETPQSEEPPARPARRYRFDRPAALTSANLTPLKAPTSPVSAHGTAAKEKRENGLSTESVPARPISNETPEVTEQKSPVQEIAPVSVEVESSTPSPNERRRRGNHERQREKEQVAPAPVVQVTPAPETDIPQPEPTPVTQLEVPLEDLPPLEYAELQAANSRRRRRRRAGTASTAAASGTPKGVLPDLATQTPPSTAVALSKNAPVAPTNPLAAQNYNIVSGYTISQMNQGNDMSGPFMGPEPSPARGSTFTTPSSLRHVRGEALRGSPGHGSKHESALMSSAAVNYLANTVTQAVQTHTDRMVAELRRANQVPTNVSVSLPPFPSNERVGVFVDVANLLYSARTLRMTVDFGKLLDFLRGNRRLVRAQAYCPTSPQPGDDQMFLQAVKGLGYRITTKNYKTFSSGAKKADLDLDLCMDVVRLVDGKAVDCIVLVSGDSDFMPMLDYCSDHGVRVEVAAFDESMSATLRQSCDLFVNLSMLEEIRA
jgi:uncharacterized LabA/DUF88 family protein